MNDEDKIRQIENEEEIRTTAISLVNEIENAVISSEGHESNLREIVEKNNGQCLTIVADGIGNLEPNYQKIAHRISSPDISSNGKDKLTNIPEYHTISTDDMVSLVKENGNSAIEAQHIDELKTENLSSTEKHGKISYQCSSTILTVGMTTPSGSLKKSKFPKLTRTQTLPNPRVSQFSVKFPKKIKSSKTSTHDTKPTKPLSDVFRSFKKSITRNRFFSKEEQTMSSIPQNSNNSRPSPRIVSSLMITPQETKLSDEAYENIEEQLTPITQKRRLMEDITDDLLNAMPPSPSSSINLSSEDQMEITTNKVKVVPSGDREDRTSTSIQPHSSEVIAETAITPVNLEKPVNEAIKRLIDDKKVADSPTDQLEVTFNKNSSQSTIHTAAKSRDEYRTNARKEHNPPPRPHSPPNVLRRMQTLSPQASRPDSCQSSSDYTRVKSMTVSPMRASMDYNTASLDRRKIYRSKTETETIKRSTITRPSTRNSTIYRQLSTIDQNADSRNQKPPIVSFERSEAIEWPPKIFRRNKSKTPISDKEEVTTELLFDKAKIASTNQSNLSGIYPCQSVSNIGGINHSSLTVLGKPEPSIHRDEVISSKPVLHHVTTRRLNEILKSSPTSNEIMMPILSERLKNLRKTLCSEIEEVRLNDTQQSLSVLHPILESFEMRTGEANDLADAEDRINGDLLRDCVVKTMQNYITVSVRIRESDMHGEFAAFHYVTGDLLSSGWTHLGFPSGWPTIHLLLDSTYRTQFALLPPLTYEPNSLIYPDFLLDALLVNWLDVGSTIHSTDAMTRREMDRTDLEFLHAASVVINLNGLVRENSDKIYSLTPLLLFSGLAVLLSLEYCQKKLEEWRIQNPDISVTIDYNLDNILILASPANFLPVFRLIKAPQTSETSGEKTVALQNQQKLLSFFGLTSCSTDSAINEAIESLTCLCGRKLTANVLLPNLMKAMIPPDWMALSLCRINLV